MLLILRNAVEWEADSFIGFVLQMVGLNRVMRKPGIRCCFMILQHYDICRHLLLVLWNRCFFFPQILKILQTKVVKIQPVAHGIGPAGIWC